LGKLKRCEGSEGEEVDCIGLTECDEGKKRKITQRIDKEKGKNIEKIP
jgi:hypothetical protein